MIRGMETTRTLQSMVTAFRTSAALSVAAELGLSDELAAGPRTLDELATAVEADRDTLGRLLRALVAIGVYAEEGGQYSNTELGEGLLSDRPGSLRPLARMSQDPAMWSAWGNLGHSVRTGENAFQALHGIDVWTHRQGRPQYNAVFNDTMTALSWGIGKAVANAYDFSGFKEVVDVGGGHGILLDAVLPRTITSAARCSISRTLWEPSRCRPASGIAGLPSAATSSSRYHRLTRTC